MLASLAPAREASAGFGDVDLVFAGALLLYPVGLVLVLAALAVRGESPLRRRLGGSLFGAGCLVFVLYALAYVRELPQFVGSRETTFAVPIAVALLLCVVRFRVPPASRRVRKVSLIALALVVATPLAMYLAVQAHDVIVARSGPHAATSDRTTVARDRSPTAGRAILPRSAERTIVPRSEPPGRPIVIVPTDRPVFVEIPGRSTSSRERRAPTSESPRGGRGGR